MAYCTECNREISQGVAYCRHCGAAQANVHSDIESASLPEQNITHCAECRGELAQDAAYCRHCGAVQKNIPTNVVPTLRTTQTGGGFRKVMKWIGIGCGGSIGLLIVLIVIGLIANAVQNDSEAKPSVAKAKPEHTTKVETTVPPTRGYAGSNPDATSAPTSTPVPTATPTPAPIQIGLKELLGEYDQNKVRANTRLRYQENSKIPVSTSGYVDEVEESYVVLTPSQERYSSERLYCYYADTRAALQVTKGQLVSVTGRVRGEDGYSSRVYMFACEFEGIELDQNPRVSAQALRQNAVQVFCVSDSIFSPSYKGTGVIIDAEEGLILTVHHVVADENECKAVEVELPGIEDRVLATTVKHCASIDRARLRVSPQALSGLSLQPIYRSTAPAQADQGIYFWGYGPGELRMGIGIVIDVVREDIITDAYAVPGDSGSPVFDEFGHLLGTMSRSNRSDRAVFTGDEC